MQIGVRHFDVIPEHLVEPDLERRDTSSRTLFRLNARKCGFAAVAKLAERVQLGVDTRRDRRLVGSDGEGRPISQRGSDLLGELAAVIPLVAETRQSIRPRSAS